MLGWLPQGGMTSIQLSRFILNIPGQEADIMGVAQIKTRSIGPVRSRGGRWVREIPLEQAGPHFRAPLRG